MDIIIFYSTTIIYSDPSIFTAPSNQFPYYYETVATITPDTRIATLIADVIVRAEVFATQEVFFAP